MTSRMNAAAKRAVSALTWLPVAVVGWQCVGAVQPVELRSDRPRKAIALLDKYRQRYDIGALVVYRCVICGS